MKSKISAIVVAIGMIGSVGAQSSYPTKPIRIIVPGAAGSVSDTIPRALTDKVARNLGQPIVIDNRSGAGGVVAFEACAKAPADGHTLCSIFPEPFTYTSVLEPDKYKRYATLEPVTQILTFSGVFYSNPKRKFSTFKDFIDAAKAKPEELTYSSWGPGSAPNLVYEWINKSEKVSVRHIPAKGSVEAFNDALAGTVDMGFIGLGFALTNIQAGKLQPLAVLGNKRSPLLPNVPSLGELGYSLPYSGGWTGIATPAGTPAAIKERIANEFRTVMQEDEGFRNNFAAPRGYIPVGSKPAEFEKILEKEMRDGKSLLEFTGVKLE